MALVNVDAAGVVVFESDRVRRIVGADKPAWLGGRVAEIEDLSPPLHPIVRAALERGESIDGLEATLRRQGGAEAPVRLHVQPVRDASSEIVGVTIALVERADEGGEIEELRVRRIYDRASALLRNAALSVASAHAFLDEAVRLLGEASDADHVYILLSTEDADAYEEEVRWAREPERSLVPLRLDVSDPPLAAEIASGVVHLERNHPSGDGAGGAEHGLLADIDAAEALALPFRTAGDRQGVLLLARGLASAPWSPIERRAVVRVGALFELILAWMRAEERYRDAISAIEYVLTTFTYDSNRERDFSLLTRQIHRLTGHELDELLAGRVSWGGDVVFGEDAAAVKTMDRELRLGRERTLVYRIRRTDGELRWLRESATPRRDASGRISVASVISDVTEQKEAEDSLLKAKHEAEAATRVKSAFLATMGHELRTPLGVIKGFADLLKEEIHDVEGAPAEAIEFADAIQANAARMARLVGDLIDIAVLQTDGLPLERSTIAIDALVREVVSRFAPRAQERGLELAVADAECPVPALADQRRVEQILDILLSNALKFTEEGTVTIGATAREEAVEIAVGDTGVGIGSDALALVCEPFYQEDNRLNRDFEGSGLGLTLARRLAEAMDGSLTIVSEKGAGTTVTLTLPQATL